MTKVPYQANERHWATGRIKSYENFLQMPQKKATFAVFDAGRQYGGPEEGGWYYNAGERVGPLFTINPKKKGAFRKLKAMAKFLSECIPGNEFLDWREDTGLDYFPSETPRYE